MSAARRLRGLAACLLAAGGLVLAAPPAQAGTPTFQFISPTKGQTLTAQDLGFHLRVGMPTSDGRLQGDVTVDFAVPAGAEGVAQLRRGAQDQRSVDVTAPLTLRWNGTYTAHAAARGRNNVLDQDTSIKRDSATFVIDAPAQQPAGVTTAVDNDTRVVTVSWAPNPEPDLIGYEVQKQASNGDWVQFDVTAETTVTDQSTAYSGGTHRYRVVALRRAANPEFANPSPHAETSADVPAPPPGTPPPPPGGGGGTGGGTNTGSGNNQIGSGSGDPGSGGANGSTGRGGSRSLPPLASSGKVDLSDLDRLLAQSGQSGGRPGEAGEDDGTYDPTLPFGARQGGDDGEGEDGEGSVLGPGDSEDVAGRLQSLGFLAGGLLATVLAMHVLWIRSEVHRAEKAEALVPLAPEPRQGVSAEARFGLSDAPERRSRSRARPTAEAAAGAGRSQDGP